MTNLLDTYLRRERIKGLDFAKAAGLTQHVVSRIRRDSQRPTLEQAFAIEAATGGEVPARSWVADHSEADAA